MLPAAILDLKKATDASVAPKAAQAETAAHGDFAADAIMRRRELAVLLRSIKTLVRQAP